MTKRLFFAVSTGLAFAVSALAQPTNIYENDGNVLVPPQVAPQIDAINFVNKGIFDINLPITPTQTGQRVTYFETSDTLNYTNRNTLSSSAGYQFDTFAGGPGGNGSRRMAANFVNTGSIIVGSPTNTNVLNNLFGFVGTAQIIASATNLTNSGLMSVGTDGLIRLTGNNVNLTRGTLKVDNTIPTNAAQFTPFGNVFVNPSAGIFDLFWGFGENTNQNFFINFNNIFSPTEQVATPTLGTNFQDVIASNFVAYANRGASGDIQVVFIGNQNPAITAEVRFQSGPFNGLGDPVVHWQGVVTNRNGSTITNGLYFTDTGTFSFGFNFLIPSGIFGIPPFLTVQTFSPEAFSFSTTFSNYSALPAGNTVFDPALVAFPNPTNFYSIYGVAVSQLTAQTVPNLAGSTISNLPGRIEINASGALDLTRTIINGGNYLHLIATNHYVGSTNAQIISPYYDINLATTNGNLSISNLVAPYAPHFVGQIGAWSCDYTNVNSPLSNRVHVLIVSDNLLPVSPVIVQNLQLTSATGNQAIIISDILNITNDPPFNTTSNILLNAVSLTTTTNDPGSASADGELNLISQQIVWSGITPRLSYVTNFGGITTLNSVFFAGSRQPPYFQTTFNEPYQTFINHGFVSVAGALIWANYFENSSPGLSSNGILSTNVNGIFTNAGTISCLTGPFTLQAGNAIMSNGVIRALSDLSLSSGTLVISNHALQTGGQLTLNVTNLLTDTGTNSSNIWQTGFGVSLPVKPTAGDLLGTTISNFSPANIEEFNVWAGDDRGATVAGFLNNAAVGHMILDGGDSASAFFFSGPGASNAIYVDLLELKDGATNQSTKYVNGQLTTYYPAVDADPNMTIYFADAVANGLDVSEKLNGSPTDGGGHVIWVSAYAGFFSSTNITYPSGITYTFNRALVQSSVIDSDGDGTPNANDPTPIFVGESIQPSLSMTNVPVNNSTVISWQTLAGAHNNLYTSTSLTNGNWSLITNFVSNTKGTVAVTNSMQTGGPHYYKVRVDPPQP